MPKSTYDNLKRYTSGPLNLFTYHCPLDALPHVFLLLEDEHVVVEELLQLLVSEVDADLLEAVVVEDLKAGDVEDTNELNPLHGGVDESLVTFLHDELECSLVERPGNAGHRAGSLGDGLTLGHPLGTNLQLGLYRGGGCQWSVWRKYLSTYCRNS